MDKTKTIIEMLAENLTGTSDNVLKKACIAYLNEDMETLQSLLQEIKLTGRANSFLQFIKHVQKMTAPEYAYQDKYFPLDNIPFAVEDFDKNFSQIPAPQRQEVAIIIKKHGGDSPTIRLLSGDPNIELNDNFINFLDTQAYTSGNSIFQKILQLLQSKIGLDKCAEFAQLHGFPLVKYAEPKKEESIEEYKELKAILGKVLGEPVVHNFFDKTTGQFKPDVYDTLPKPEKDLIEAYLKKVQNGKDNRPTR